MKIVYSLNKRKIWHLIEALRMSGFVPEEKEKKIRSEVNQSFLERVKAFLGSTRGKGVRRSLNAFRTIAPESFGGIPKYQDFVDRQVKVSLIVFFAKILEPKECKKALIVAGLTMKSAEKIALNAVRKQDDKVLVSDIPSAKKAAHISIVNSIILEEVCFPKMAVDGSDRVTLSA